MGRLCSKTQLVLTESLDFPVHVDIVEQTFRDTKSVPQFIPDVCETEFVRGDSGTSGACWNEMRLFQGKEYILRKTITHVSQDPFCMSVHVEYVNSGCCYPSPENTSTIVIEPGHKDGVCTVTKTLAFLSRGVVDKLLFAFFLPRLKHAFTASVRENLQHFSKEAVRREMLLMESEKEAVEETNKNKDATSKER